MLQELPRAKKERGGPIVHESSEGVLPKQWVHGVHSIRMRKGSIKLNLKILITLTSLRVLDGCSFMWHL